VFFLSLFCFSHIVCRLILLFVKNLVVLLCVSCFIFLALTLLRPLASPGIGFPLSSLIVPFAPFLIDFPLSLGGSNWESKQTSFRADLRCPPSTQSPPVVISVLLFRGVLIQAFTSFSFLGKQRFHQPDVRGGYLSVSVPPISPLGFPPGGDK